MEATHVECSLSGELIPIEQAVELHNGDIADKEHENVVEIDGEYYDTEQDDVIFVESEGCYMRRYDVTWSDSMSEHIKNDDVVTSYCGDCATEEWFESNDYSYIGHGRAEGQWLYCDQTSYCVDIGERVHEYDATWHEVSEEYYYDVDEMPDDSSCDHIARYHGSPEPDDLSDGSQFKIGIEIEKNELEGCYEEGEHIGKYDLFKGFENDSSCGGEYNNDGVEAITHILPLDAIDSENEKKVFKMFEEAREVIDEEEIDLSCGGHMTVSCTNELSESYIKGSSHSNNVTTIYVSQENALRQKMRINSSILYALYRYRLKNTYCVNDKDMKSAHTRTYPVVALKSMGRVEFRLFSGIRSVKQLKLRYRLMYQLMNHSINKESNYSLFLLSVMPILREMYNGNDEKLKNIIKLSYKFKTFFELGYVDTEIQEFLSEYYKPKSKIQQTLCV